MRLDKRSRRLPFLRHISRLAKLRVSPRLFRPGNRLPAVAGMLVKNVVVPKPQLKREIRPQRDQSMKGNEVANRPRHATQSRNADRQRPPFPARAAFSAPPKRNPAQQKRQQSPKRRI